jgi:hypothetical protein
MCAAAMVDRSDVRSQLVWLGESRRASTLDTFNYRTPKGLFTRMLGRNVSLEFLLSTKGPLVAATDVIVREARPFPMFARLPTASSSSDGIATTPAT